MTRKIVSIGPRFENMEAFAAHIAEDDSITGFCGAVLRVRDGVETTVIVSFGMSRAEMALASVMMAAESIEGS